MGFIYKITNVITGKCYIGETAKDDPEKRWKQHLGTIRRGAGCPALRDAVNKYGIDNFKFEVLIICFDDVRFEMEKLYIKKYNSQVPNGYNISAGGMGGNFTGRKHTPETLSRIIEKTKIYRQNNPDWYEKIREKHKQSMSKVDTGNAVKKSEKFKKALAEGRVGGARQRDKENSEEIKQKIRQGVLRYYELNGTNSCRVNIDKHREAMAKASGIKISKYDANGTLILTYNSVSEAARQENIKKATLLNRINKQITVHGIYWQKFRPKGSSIL